MIYFYVWWFIGYIFLAQCYSNVLSSKYDYLDSDRAKRNDPDVIIRRRIRSLYVIPVALCLGVFCYPLLYAFSMVFDKNNGLFFEVIKSKPRWQLSW